MAERVARAPREVALGPLACAMALCALAGAAAALGWLPEAVLPFATAPLLAGGAVWALFARDGDEASSWIKLAVVGWLLAPVLLLVPWLALRAGPFEGEAGARGALAVVLALAALAQVRARGKRVRLERPGAATAFAIALGVALAALAAALVFQGSAPRVSYHGLLHGALLLATERAVPPENPWMAGAPLGYYWVWHALGGLFAHALRLAPTEALVATNVWAAAPLPLVLQLCVSTLVRGARREVAGVVGGLFGLGAVSGWVWLMRGAESAPASSLVHALAVFDELARGVPSDANGAPLFDRRLAWAFSKFGNTNSYPAALALTAGAWFGAAHALRHGVRPWPLITALMHGGAALLNPLVGVIGAAPTLAVALFAPWVRARARTLAACLVALAPAVALTVAASSAYGGESLHFAPSWPAVRGALLPLAPLLPLAAWAVAAGVPGRGWPRDEPRAAVAALLTVGAFAPLALHALVELPYDNQYKLVRIAALPLGVLAGVGAVGLVAAGGWRRVAALVVVAATAGGAAANEWRCARAYLAFARHDLPLVERPLVLLPEARPGSAGADLAAAYAWLREARALRERRPVLVLDAFERVGYAFGDPPFAFVEPHNLQGHEAPAFAALDLWFDRPSQVLDARTPGLEERRIAINQLLRQREAWNSDVLATLREAGRPVVVLVGPRDTERVPGLASKFRLGGFASLARFGAVELFVYPPELAPDGGGQH